MKMAIDVSSLRKQKQISEREVPWV